MKHFIVTCFIVFLILLSVQSSDADTSLHTENIVIILDASGSMKEKFRADPTQSKMDAAKEALKAVLAKVPDNTHIGLLVFSGSNVQDDWVYPLGPKRTEQLLAAIDGPQPGGGTPLGQYMRIGTNRLLEQREKQYNYGNYRLLIVTDGAAQDAEKVAQYTPEILDRHIRVDVIGVDMEMDHLLAKDADSYRRADNPGELVAAVTQILAETGGTGNALDAEDAYADIAPLSGEIALDLIQQMTLPPSNAAIATTIMRKTPSQQQKPSTHTPPQPVQQSRGNNSTWILIGLIIVIGGFLIFRRMGK